MTAVQRGFLIFQGRKDIQVAENLEMSSKSVYKCLKGVDIELTDAEEKRIRQFDADVQKRAQLRYKLKQEYKALLPVQELPPAVELGEIVTLATIYTAFCKR